MTRIIDWPEGTRLTGMSGSPQGSGRGLDGVALLHLIDLPEGQQGNVEESMAHGLLPFAGTSIHGVYPEGSEWMVMAQVGIVDEASGFDSHDEAADTFRAHLERYLQVNPSATVVSEALLHRFAMITGYQQSGVPIHDVADWSVEEFLAGMVCEMCGVDLENVVAGRDSGCSFPDMDHFCTGDAFSDVFAQWARGLLMRGDSEVFEDDDLEDLEEIPDFEGEGDVIVVPGPDAGLGDIWEFALTYNAYDRFDGPLGDFANGAKGMWMHMGQMPWDLDSLRAALFYEQRRMRHLQASLSDKEMDYLRALIRSIRNKAGDVLPGPPDPLP